MYAAVSGHAAICKMLLNEAASGAHVCVRTCVYVRACVCVRVFVRAWQGRRVRAVRV